MNCPICYKDLEDTSKVCNYCGNTVNKHSVTKSRNKSSKINWPKVAYITVSIRLVLLIAIHIHLFTTESFGNVLVSFIFTLFWILFELLMIYMSEDSSGWSILLFVISFIRLILSLITFNIVYLISNIILMMYAKESVDINL